VRTQDEINDLMVEHARAGRRVVRLKGGDPFVFGRGGEELDFLGRHGIAAHAVPGITAALGCASAARIPLTHRGLSKAVTFVTGHGEHGDPDLDWEILVRLGETLVIYMGVNTAGRTSRQLIDHGLDPGTPVAVVENGTRPEQKVVRGAVWELQALIDQHNVKGPALLIVGAVAAEADAKTLTGLAHQDDRMIA
jgi:uroporphyrin-III C-methyltransferase